MLPKYDDKNALGNFGVSYVQMIVTGAKSIFQEIDTKHDLGIDAIIELIKDQYPTHRRIAVQIKTGSSYYNSKKDECEIPIDSHAEYWINYEMPVLGIVYVPEKECGYWVDIKKYFEKYDKPSSIKFACSQVNRFTPDGFRDYFIPYNLQQVPSLPLETAQNLVLSEVGDDASVGITVLFRKYCNEVEAWRQLIGYFRQKDISQIPKRLVIFLSYVNSNPDLFTTGKGASQETRKYAQSLIDDFGKDDIVKLLMFIDEHGIDRGTLGQAVETIISSSKNFNKPLSEITQDRNFALEIREYAGLIYAYNNHRLAIPLLETVSKDSKLFEYALEGLQENGRVFLY